MPRMISTAVMAKGAFRAGAYAAMGSPVLAWSSVAASGEGEVGQAAEAGDSAVEGERGEGAGLEVAQQEADGQVGADAREQASGQDLAADAVAERPGQVGDLEGPGGEDDGGGEQEREPGGVLVGQAARQAPDHGDPGTADAGEQGEDLHGADEHGLGVAEACQPLVGGAVGGELMLAAGVVARG